jgi:hypothetical protein
VSDREAELVEAVEAMAEKLTALTSERDRLRSRIDAYEGHLQEWEATDAKIRASSLGTEAAQSLRQRTPPEVAKAVVLGSQYLARAEAAEAQRDRLRVVVQKLWGAWNDATLNDPERYRLDLTRDESRALDDVVQSFDRGDVMGGSHTDGGPR